MNIVIYHKDCPDGSAAALAAALRFGFGDREQDAVMFMPAAYGKTVPPDVSAEDDVYMLDFCFDRDQVITMAEKAHSVTILDHHKSAMDACGDLIDGVKIRGTFDMTKSGAMLAWEYFCTDIPPDLVKYVEDRDLWAWKLPDSEAINAAILTVPHTLRDWQKALEVPTDTWKLRGATILEKQRRDIDELLQFKHTLKIGGYDVPSVNCPYFHGSDLCDRLTREYPLAAYYFYDGSKWKFGLRSNKENPNWVDVAEVAVKYGGGGHATASGFILKSLEQLEGHK